MDILLFIVIVYLLVDLFLFFVKKNRLYRHLELANLLESRTQVIREGVLSSIDEKLESIDKSLAMAQVNAAPEEMKDPLNLDQMISLPQSVVYTRRIIKSYFDPVSLTMYAHISENTVMLEDISDKHKNIDMLFVGATQDHYQKYIAKEDAISDGVHLELVKGAG